MALKKRGKIQTQLSQQGGVFPRFLSVAKEGTFL